MIVGVVILYRLELVEETAVYITVAAVRCTKKGKRTGGAFNFLIPAVYDHRSNGYIPVPNEKVYNIEDDEYFNSIFDFVKKKFGCSYRQTKLLKVKDMNEL